MSINKIPGDICKSIFSRLPVRSVLACKCVCKSWLNLISNSDDFVQMHLEFHRENSTCLLFGAGESETENNTLIYSVGYDSLASLLLPEMEDENDNNDVEMPEVEDNSSDFEMDYSSSTSSEDSSSILSWIDGYLAQMEDYPFKDSDLKVDLFGSCNGVVCLWFHDNRNDDLEEFFCLWNPATKEYKKISQAPKRYRYWAMDITLYALVFDPASDNYKFVIAVSHKDKTNGMSSLFHVYSLASDSWKSFLSPHGFCSTQKSGVLFNGGLHWFDYHSRSIVSLDIRNENFKEIPSPCEYLRSLQLISVGVLEECLCVLVDDADNLNIEIWAMQVYGDPKSWTKCYTVTHKIMKSRISCYCSYLRFMWSFKNGVILFTDYNDLVLYDPENDSGIEKRMVVYMPSVENYSESLVSLNSGTFVGGRTANSSSVELQKEAEKSGKDDDEETAMAKKKGRKKKAEYQYNTRKASKAVVASPRESTNFEDESLTVQQRAEQEQVKLVPLTTGSTLEPYQIKEGYKTHSTSKESYHTMTVKRLHALLKERGLVVKGKKDELIARLRAFENLPEHAFEDTAPCERK